MKRREACSVYDPSTDKSPPPKETATSLACIRSRDSIHASRECALVASNANLIKRINHFNVTRRHVATKRRGDEAKGVERERFNVGEIGREGVERRKREKRNGRKKTGIFASSTEGCISLRL